MQGILRHRQINKSDKPFYSTGRIFMYCCCFSNTMMCYHLKEISAFTPKEQCVLEVMRPPNSLNSQMKVGEIITRTVVL